MDVNDIKKEIEEQKTSLLLSMVDLNILQSIFIQLVDGYVYSTYCETDKEIQKAFALLPNFSLSCKLFSQISKQPLFPLILNNINIDLNYKKYLKILFIKQQVEKDQDCKKKDINNIFYQNCNQGYFDTIKTLIDYGEDINYKGVYYDWTPLIAVTINGYIKTVSKLIKFKNLNINQTDVHGLTALMCACLSGLEDIVKILLSRKDIDISILNNEGKTALECSKQYNRESIVKILENYQN